MIAHARRKGFESVLLHDKELAKSETFTRPNSQSERDSLAFSVIFAKFFWWTSAELSRLNNSVSGRTGKLNRLPFVAIQLKPALQPQWGKLWFEVFYNLHSPMNLAPVAQLNCSKHKSHVGCMHITPAPDARRHIAEIASSSWELFLLLSSTAKDRDAKGCKVRSGVLGTCWPQQHVSFHASFIHFITSLDECEGVGEKPCHPETEREDPHSVFSPLGPALPLRLLGECVANVAPAASCHVSPLHQATHGTRADWETMWECINYNTFFIYLYTWHLLHVCPSW